MSPKSTKEATVVIIYKFATCLEVQLRGLGAEKGETNEQQSDKAQNLHQQTWQPDRRWYILSGSTALQMPTGV